MFNYPPRIGIHNDLCHVLRDCVHQNYQEVEPLPMASALPVDTEYLIQVSLSRTEFLCKQQASLSNHTSEISPLSNWPSSMSSENMVNHWSWMVSSWKWVIWGSSRIPNGTKPLHLKPPLDSNSCQHIRNTSKPRSWRSFGKDFLCAKLLTERWRSLSFWAKL